MDSTTVKALRIMEALSVSDDERGVSELSRQVGLTKSNTFRILSTLVDQGYVQSNPETSRYFLTLKIWEQGARVIDRNPIRRVARPHLQALFAKINETILVSVIDLPDVLYIEKIESQ
jgi:DNA-binding IclR family transcriptional regulator